MRRAPGPASVILGTLLSLVAVAGCTGGGGVAAREAGGSGSGSAAGATCEEVRLGIGAFNAGDLDETVEHFEKAVPLARSEDDGSPRAADLLEAVEYYAELPTEDYLEASASSPEFERYKQITLGQCGDAEEPPAEDEDPGTLT